MRTILLIFWLVITPSPVVARSLHDASKPLEGRSVLATNQFERHIDELRAAHPHTDHYLVLHFEIEVMRRDNPEYSDFLERYLKSVLQSER